MPPHHEMENDLAYWLEAQGFAAVIDALVAACQWYVDYDATTGADPTTTTQQWQDRLDALRTLQWEGR